MADKKPGRGGSDGPKKKGKKPPKPVASAPAARKTTQRYRAPVRHRLYEGQIATPVRYSGPGTHGSYMAAMVNGKTVYAANGEPIRFHDLPLETVARADF